MFISWGLLHLNSHQLWNHEPFDPTNKRSLARIIVDLQQWCYSHQFDNWIYLHLCDRWGDHRDDHWKAWESWERCWSPPGCTGTLAMAGNCRDWSETSSSAPDSRWISEHQSEISVILSQPIRGEYLPVGPSWIWTLYHSRSIGTRPNTSCQGCRRFDYSHWKQ